MLELMVEHHAGIFVLAQWQTTYDITYLNQSA